MSKRYLVKKLRGQSGERFSMLIDAETGVPLWSPTIFVVTELRATNLASATLDQATRALKVLHQVLDHLGINLEERLKEGRLLNVSELDELVRLAGATQEELDALPMPKEMPLRIPTLKSLEKARMPAKLPDSKPQVASQTKAIRLMYIRDYFAWLGRRRLLGIGAQKPEFQALSTHVLQVVGHLNARIPSSKKNNALDERQGISDEVEARILEVTRPDSLENPWKNEHVRIRNQLIFRWLLALGLRRGEFLGIKLQNIDLRTGEVQVIRHADDPEDSRSDEPKTKGNARVLVLGDDLAELTRTYVHGPRRAIEGARRHPFLTVATGTGKPLSMSAVSKLFVELRRKVPGLPEELCPHVLRHTWNDRFSEFADKSRIAPEEEQKIRKQQMGWSDRSNMAVVYTRRHTRRKTNEASLAMQAEALGVRRFEK